MTTTYLPRRSYPSLQDDIFSHVEHIDEELRENTTYISRRTYPWSSQDEHFFFPHVEHVSEEHKVNTTYHVEHIRQVRKMNATSFPM